MPELSDLAEETPVFYRQINEKIKKYKKTLSGKTQASAWGIAG